MKKRKEKRERKKKRERDREKESKQAIPGLDEKKWVFKWRETFQEDTEG